MMNRVQPIRAAGAFRRIAAVLAVLAAAALPACAHPVTLAGLETSVAVEPEFRPSEKVFIAEDGARLGLSTWAAKDTDNPEYVVVGVHGMSDYAGAFHMAAPYWAKHGVTTYAYDQRGFGRSPGKGYWPEEELLRKDLRTAVDVARKRHPDAVITVVGISMGAAVAMTAFGSDDPPKADRLILSGPALRGWGALNPLYRVSLYTSTHINPGWLVVPPAGLIKIEPSDNIEMLRRTWSDPNMTYKHRIDQVFGLVELMEHAHVAANDLPKTLPILASYGAKDIVVPQNGVERTARWLGPNVRTVYYPNGYHMLLRDLQSQKVFDDYLAFMHDPESALPSGEGEWPFRHCDQQFAAAAADAPAGC